MRSDKCLLSNESIKEIKGRPGYFLDLKGNVYSQWVNKGRHGLVKENNLKLLKGCTEKRGYNSIQFCGSRDSKLVHRLMIETFVGPIPDGFVVRHMDDNPKNNSLDNLAVGTQKDNMHDCINHDRFKFIPTKLNWKNVRLIRNIKKQTKVSNSVLADRFGVTRRTVDKIIKNQIWKEIV